MSISNEPPPSEMNKTIKVTVRRLPPRMTWNELEEQLSPIPSYSYHSFSPPHPELLPHSFATLSLGFESEEDVLSFANRFHGYIFVDCAGNESQAIVEFSPYQKLPKTSREEVGNDKKIATIESDPSYLAFLTELEEEGKKQVTIEDQLKEIEEKERKRMKAEDEVVDTPLLQFFMRDYRNKRTLEDMRKKTSKRTVEVHRKKNMPIERSERGETERERGDKERIRTRPVVTVVDVGERRRERETKRREEEERANETGSTYRTQYGRDKRDRDRDREKVGGVGDRRKENEIRKREEGKKRNETDPLHPSHFGRDNRDRRERDTRWKERRGTADDVQDPLHPSRFGRDNRDKEKDTRWKERRGTADERNRSNEAGTSARREGDTIQSEKVRDLLRSGGVSREERRAGEWKVIGIGEERREEKKDERTKRPPRRDNKGTRPERAIYTPGGRKRGDDKEGEKAATGTNRE